MQPPTYFQATMVKGIFRSMQADHYFRTLPSGATLTDVTRGLRRPAVEAERKALQEKMDELTRRMTAIEDEAIKKMPAEDQRAAEGLDRPVVVRKVPRYLDGAGLARYRRLRKELDDLKRRPTPSQELALSVNHCLVSPPATHVLVRGNAHALRSARR